MPSTRLFIQGLHFVVQKNICRKCRICVQWIFLTLTAALSSTVAAFGPWKIWALCGLPEKALAPMILIRQEHGRQALEFCAPHVAAQRVLQRGQGLNGTHFIFSSNVSRWVRLLLLFSLSAQESVKTLPWYHDGQTSIYNGSVLRQSSCLHLTKSFRTHLLTSALSLLFC